jgi:RNA recognition motif-containing protein
MDIYVGSIPFKWKEKDLIDLFSQYGNVESVKIVINKMTRQNKGFGFVSMPDETEAHLAMQSLNGQEFLGRVIQVTPSMPVKKPSRTSATHKVNKSSDQQNKWKGPHFRKK